MANGRIARLSADLVANSTKFESGLTRANRAMGRAKQSWNSDLSRAGRSFSQFESQIKRSVGSIVDLRTQLGGIAAVTASALSVQKVIKYSDEWKSLEGRLKVAAGEMANIQDIQSRLFDVSQQNSAPLRDVIDAYARLSLAMNDTQKQQTDLIQVTDLLSKTLLISGTNAAGAATFFQQFGQAASSDFKAVGQEIQTFQDQNAFFVKILQENLDLGGRSLKQFAADGDLSIEKIVQALIKGQGRIEKAAADIPNTVGKALQRLDNAFLRFIGQTDAIATGTNSLAVGLNALADNFEILAKAVAGVAVVMGVRMLQSLGAVIASMTVAAARTVAFNFALGTLAFGSRAASVAFIGLAGATTALGTAIAFLGGPVGVAVIGTLALMSQYTNAARDAQLLLNQAVADHRQSAAEYISASDERRQAIEDNTRANIENYKKELEAIEKIAQALEGENALFRFSRKIGSKLGIDTSAEDVREVADQVRGVIKDLEADLATFDKNRNAPRPGAGGGGDDDKKAQKKIKDLLDGLKQESEQLELQTKLYGEKEGAIARAQQALKIQQQLEQQGIQLTKEQQAQVEKYLESIERQTDLQEEQAQQQKELEQRERDRQQALNQLGATFESAFEDAIVEGEKLSDVLQGLLDDILRILTRITITEPLGNALGDLFGGLGKTSTSSTSSSSSGGGIFSGIGNFFGDLFGGSFASGIDYVPRDMYAKLHRGESVRTVAETQAAGGNEVVINVYNADGSKAASERRQQNGNGPIDVDLAMAENLSRKGSKSNQAILGILNQTRTRR